MNDMSQVIVPKSDQINADDLIGRDMTITIRDVHIRGGQEQPVSIFFEGSEKAFRPCKSMSRVLVAAWGPDAKVYIGRALTLYRDPTVKWGGLEVGGIRISHMSHIDKPMTMALTATKGSRKPYTVQPLVAQVKPIGGARQTPEEWARGQIEAVAACEDVAALDRLIDKGAKAMGRLESEHPTLHRQVADAYETRRDYFADQDGDDDPFGENDGTLSADNPAAAEGPADSDRGEGFADTDSPAEDAPWQAASRTISDLIAAATDKASWEKADKEFQRHAAALPDEIRADLDAALGRKRRELAG